MKRRWCSTVRLTRKSPPTWKIHKRSNLQSPLWTWAETKPSSNTLSTCRMDHLLCRSVVECPPWRSVRQERHLSTRMREVITCKKPIRIEWRCLRSVPRSSKIPVRTIGLYLLHRAALDYVALRLSVQRSNTWGISCNKWEITKSSKGSLEGENVSCKRVGGMGSWALMMPILIKLKYSTRPIALRNWIRMLTRISSTNVDRSVSIRKFCAKN